MRLVSAVFFSCVIFSAQGADPLQQCRTIQQPAERLQCYDQYVDARVTAPTQASVSHESPAPVAEVTEVAEKAIASNAARDEALFGTSGETIKSEITDLSVQVAAIATDARENLVFTLHNGQRWQQIEHGFIKVKSGDTCVISSGMFGSFKMKCQQGSKTIRVKRVH